MFSSLLSPQLSYEFFIETPALLKNRQQKKKRLINIKTVQQVSNDEDTHVFVVKIHGVPGC